MFKSLRSSPGQPGTPQHPAGNGRTSTARAGWAHHLSGRLPASAGGRELLSALLSRIRNLPSPETHLSTNPIRILRYLYTMARCFFLCLALPTDSTGKSLLSSQAFWHV